MNATVIKGLFQDALYQVLDNKVFRVLMFLTAIPILTTLLVGVREDGFSMVFGLWEIDYPDWVAMFGEDPQAILIEMYLGLVIDGLVGSLGLTICIAATAFFVPRMLEKGAADLVFVKPVPRWLMYASRYVTGLVFVGLLGLILTVGTYLGVLVASGVSYPGILWSTLTLIYVFAMVHGVTMLIGLLTRSTPASMILGVIFFMGNGMIHSGWMWADMLRHQDSVVAEMVGIGDHEDPVDEEAEEEEPSAWKAVGDVALRALDVAHYALPKTNDASLVVLHTEEALLGSGRLSTLAGISEGFTEQNEELASETDQEAQADPELWRAQNFGYGADELRYSAWFSLLSSLAFVGAMLGIGFWRLRRVDF